MPFEEDVQRILFSFFGVTWQEISENPQDSIFFSYDQGTTFRGSRLYITGHTAEGETAAFSEAILCE